MALLKIGSKGDDVKKLQAALGITADGIYGSQTEAAVKAYQKANGLTVDGLAGNQTLGSLYKPVQTTPTISTPTQTAADKKIADLTAQWGTLSPGYADAIKSGTESDYLANIQKTVESMPVIPETKPATSTLPDISGLSNINFNTAPVVYQDPYADKINALLDKYLSTPSFSYDPSSDTGLQAAQDDAMAAVNRLAGRTGMIYSDSNKSQLGKSALSLIPQFEQAAFNKYQAGLGNIINQLQELQGLSRDSRNQFESDRNFNRDVFETERTYTDKTENEAFQKQLDTLSQYYSDFQAEINRREAINPNDPLLPYLRAARQQKLAELEAQQKAAEQTAYERNIEQQKLALDKRYTEAQIENMKADNARAWQQVNEASGTKAEQKARDEQYQREFTRMMSSADPAAYLSSVRASLHPDVYAELSKFISKEDNGPTLSDKIAAITADLGTMTPDAAYAELTNYAADYIRDLGTTEYNRLLGIYTQLAGK